MTILVLDISIPQISSHYDVGIIVYLIAIGIPFVYMILIPALLPNKMMHRIPFGLGDNIKRTGLGLANNCRSAVPFLL
jgi:hypothetical protein